MACISSAHMKAPSHKRVNNDNETETGETALSHSMKIDLTPLLIAGGSGFERIPILSLREGKA